jgi:hypothetical protein
MVFSTYQVHGAYAHLHQHNNEEVTDAISDATGSPLPRVWDPLRRSIPYQYLSASLFKPPDCYFGQWIAVISIMIIYMAPLCRRAAYPTCLRLFPLPFKARPRKNGQNVARSFHHYI